MAYGAVPPAVPWGFSGEAAAAWAAAGPPPGSSSREQTDRADLAALASDDDRFDWGFLGDMRASIRRSQSGALPAPALAALQQARMDATRAGTSDSGSTKSGGESTDDAMGDSADEADGVALLPRRRRHGSRAQARPSARLVPVQDAPPAPSSTAADGRASATPLAAPLLGLAPSPEDAAIARLVVAFDALADERRDVWGQRALLQLERLWAEAKVSERDRQVFRSAHCEPPMTASKAVAVAQHLSLLAEHSASLEAVKAAARAREDGMAMLRKVLADALDGWPRQAVVGAAADDTGVDEWALAGSHESVPFSDLGRLVPSSSCSSADGAQAPGAEAALPQAPEASSTAAEAAAAAKSAVRSELAGGKWRARGVEHSSHAALKAADTTSFAGAEDLTAEERRFAIKHRVRARALMLHVLRHILAACENIVRWRNTMWRPHAFLWRGRNLLRAIRKDLEFLVRDPAASTLARLRVPQDELDVLLAFWKPPSMRPEGAAPSAVAPAGSDFGSVLGLCNRGILPPDLRLVARVDRALAVVHSEPGLQKRLARETELLESKGLFVPILLWRLAESQSE